MRRTDSPMKFHLVRVALLALLVLPFAARAETVDLGTHGTFSIAVPKGWTVSSHKEEDSGVAVTLSSSGTANAKCLINISFVLEPKPMPKEMLDEQVLGMCEQFVNESVEKKKVLRDFGLAGGAYGSYCVFTDASQVGQPIVRDVFKVIAVGAISFKDDVIAAVSIAGDDEKGADFSGLIAAVKSAAILPAK